MVKNVDDLFLVTWPNNDLTYQFNFDTITPDGVFSFEFKWLNDRWNCWVTLPDETVRQCGVEPNTANWSGFLDYGVIFVTDLTTITYDQLFTTELYILKWE